MAQSDPDVICDRLVRGAPPLTAELVSSARRESCKSAGLDKKGSATGSGRKLTRYRRLKSDDFANEFGGAPVEFVPRVEVFDLQVPAVQDRQDLQFQA